MLLRLVNADFKFTYTDIGFNGSNSDGRVYRNVTLCFSSEVVSLETLPKKSLSTGQRIFGHRLSRARRVFENSFEILANSIIVLLSPLSMVPENVWIGC